MVAQVSTARIPLPMDRIAGFCQRWHVCEFALFGSVLREDFRPESDVDVLVTFEPETHPTLFDIASMEAELESLFGRKVDLLSRRGVEMSRNPYRRRAILESAQVIHAR